ncbi:MAG: glycosyltransferase family 2 protein [Candidatus Omnitrophica bacterium]|nr:glycosyltransferase family 2 protein [Candidatus Omnitrophota bacterium]MDD5027124.1 glycosyltransferase family 2 protein [Candidatus Omnitrophota bacterium]MDD5662240.1 glycosyltransferase family 2 protein [Candidatus Omnitrophota bacterium]
MISVIIITYNRKFLLKKTIASILALDIGERFEVVIIDNGSCDGTAEHVLEEYRGKVKLIRNKTRTSLSACKELGVSTARGEIIAFIDDDCLASENWLKNIRKALPDYDFLAGPVLPSADIKFPWWWRNSLNWLIGINLKPDKKFPPLGSNIVFKKNVFKAGSLKDNNLLLPYAEDRIRIAKLLNAGFSMGINQGMIVYHHVPLARLKITYLIQRSYNEGLASAVLERSPKTALLNMLGLMINPLRLILFVDSNYFFRIIANLSYLFNLIIPGSQRHRNQNHSCISCP